MFCVIRPALGVVILLSISFLHTLAGETDEDFSVFISAENIKGGDGMYCDVGLGDWDHHVTHPYAIQAGDVLEYDLLVSPDSPEMDGGLFLTFQGGGALSLPAGPMGSGQEWSKSSNPWRQIRIPIGMAAGRNLENWIFHISGKKQGVYQLAIDRLRISNRGVVKCSFYENEPVLTGRTVRFNGFRTPHVTVFPRRLIGEREVGALFNALHGLGAAQRRLTAAQYGASLVFHDYQVSGKPKGLPELIEKARPLLDDSLFADFRLDEFNQKFPRALEVLEPIHPLIKGYTLHAVGYAHLDFIWMWSWEDTLRTARQDFRQVLSFMDEFPAFTFSYTSPALFEALEKEDPVLFRDIQKQAQVGRWEMVGSRWCEADAEQISEESNARHFLYSHRYNLEKFGVESRVDFEPDIFGHLPTFPQLLLKSGVKYYASRRMKGPEVFWWEGLDGSRVLATNIHHYMDSLLQEPLDYSFTREGRSHGFKDALVVYGVGNHGGGPSHDEIQNIQMLNQLSIYPQVPFSRFHDYMDRIAMTRLSKPLKVVKQDVGHPLNGTYSVNGVLKKLNRVNENLLTTTESFYGISRLLGFTSPIQTLDAAWKKLLWGHHHDTISGTTIHESSVYARDVLRSVRDSVQGDLDRILGNLSSQIVTDSRSGIPRVIFNPLAWKASQPVTFVLPDTTHSWDWIDSAGTVHPIQVSGIGGVKNEGVAVISGLPGLGHRTGWLVESSGQETNGLKRIGSFVAENRFLRMTLSPSTGNLTSIKDLRTGREWVRRGEECGRLRIEMEAPHAMSAWLMGEITGSPLLDRPAKVECVEEGPVRITFRSTYRYRDSTIEKDVMLYRDMGRVDIALRVDWRERGGEMVDAPMLRMEFPLPGKCPEAMYLVPFGEVSRPQDGADYAASYGVGLSTASGSVCVLNDYKCGYSVSNQTIRVTLNRSPYSPDPAPDVGIQTMHFGFYVSDKKWSEAGMSRRGMEFNRNPVVVETTRHGGVLPAEKSFLSVAGESVVVTAVKTSFDDDSALVLRLYQASGTPGDAKITSSLPERPWRETDLIERFSDRSPPASLERISLKPWEIKTFRMGNLRSSAPSDVEGRPATRP